MWKGLSVFNILASLTFRCSFKDTCKRPVSNHVVNNNGKRKESSASVIFVPLRSYEDGYLGESQENFDDLEMLKASPLSQKKVTFNKHTDANNDNTITTKWKEPEQVVRYLFNDPNLTTKRNFLNLKITIC